MTQIKIYLLILSSLISFVLVDAQKSSSYLFTNARVFDGMEMQDDWYVAVKGNKIAYAGPAKHAIVTDGEIIDATGMTLLPGLIEGHSHLFLHPYNETDWNDQVLKESFAERTVRATMHAQATIMAGFTTIRDLGTEGGGYLDVGLKTAIEKGVAPGPRMLVAGKAIVATGSYGPKGFAPHVQVPLGAEPVDGPDIIREVRDQIGNGVDLIKVYADYRWGLGGVAAPTFSIEEMKMMVETAAASGRQVVAHAATKEGMRRAVIAGVKTIEHGDGGTKEVFQLMKDNDVCLCPTLAAGDAIMQYRGWEKGVEPDPERIVQKKKSFQQALSVGVKICAGGDVGVFTHGDNVRELEMMVEYGMEPIDVLRSATSINASTFELSELGQIKKGFLADLVIVNGNPVEQINNLRKVKFVMKDGIVYRNEL
jgi:imidazolonepropionase-like amidohydrolase